MTLPDMSVIDTHLPSNHKTRAYTAEQMLAWGKANAEAEREACAVICEKMRHPWGHSAETQDWVGATEHCAAAIRARGEKV